MVVFCRSSVTSCVDFRVKVFGNVTQHNSKEANLRLKRRKRKTQIVQPNVNAVIAAFHTCSSNLQ